MIFPSPPNTALHPSHPPQSHKEVPCNSSVTPRHNPSSSPSPSSPRHVLGASLCPCPPSMALSSPPCWNHGHGDPREVAVPARCPPCWHPEGWAQDPPPCCLHPVGSHPPVSPPQDVPEDHHHLPPWVPPSLPHILDLKMVTLTAIFRHKTAMGAAGGTSSQRDRGTCPCHPRAGTSSPVCSWPEHLCRPHPVPQAGVGLSSAERGFAPC